MGKIYRKQKTTLGHCVKREKERKKNLIKITLTTAGRLFGQSQQQINTSRARVGRATHFARKTRHIYCKKLISPVRPTRLCVSHAKNRKSTTTTRNFFLENGREENKKQNSFFIVFFFLLAPG